MNLILAVELALAALGGLVLGSFLSVLVSRLPSLVLAEAKLRSLLKAISWPPSHCHACDNRLSWHDNLPLLSYLMLRGRCRHCGVAYGKRYLVLEGACALAGMLTVLALGWNGEAFCAFLLIAMLLALTAIDLESQLLPDLLVIPLLPMGLLFQVWYRGGLMTALLGASAAGLSMWAIGAAYRLGRQREGLGLGDVKLAAVLGAWLGLSAVPFFLTGAFAIGLATSLPFLLSRRLAADTALPFGPFLGVSAALFLLVPSALPWMEQVLYGA